MLINLSNHNSAHWSKEQKEHAVSLYGSIKDMPFPDIPPQHSTKEVYELAAKYAALIHELAPACVHVMGEFTFCFAVVGLLQQQGISCIASTCHRNTIDHPDGSKTSVFHFEQFRPYPVLNQAMPKPKSGFLRNLTTHFKKRRTKQNNSR